MSAYATATDYAGYLGAADDYDDAERTRINAGLLRAQDDVVRAIRATVFDPSDETVQAELTRATCARFQYLEETGDETGAAAQWQTVRAGQTTLARSDRDSVQALSGRQTLDGKTVTILINAGLVSGIVSAR